MTNKFVIIQNEILSKPFSLKSSEVEGKVIFLSVCIDNYFRETNLYECKSNSKRLTTILKKWKILNDENIFEVSDHEATKKNIENVLYSIEDKLTEKDTFIFYFSGHSYSEKNINFYVPCDGKRENFASCISSDHILALIQNIRSKAALFIVDTEEANPNKEDLEFIRTEKSKASLRKENSCYLDFIDFLSEKTEQRQKESYLFLKYKPVADVPEKDFISGSTIKGIVRSKFNTLKTLTNEQKTGEALNELKEIVETNDDDYLSRVQTLQFQMFKNKNLFNRNLIPVDDYQKNIAEINGLTIELIEKINEKGFYVVNIPDLPRKDRLQLPQPKKTKILFVSANPIDTDPLRLDRELREIEYELLRAKYRDSFELIKGNATRISDFQQALLDYSPNFIHFSGHGNCDGIAFLDNNDLTHLIRNEPLANLFQLFSEEIQCVFLNSCHSIAQSTKISNFIPKVVCMSKSVPDNIAIQFASSFYKSIGAGRNIDFSFKFAKNSIELYNLSGGEIPVLLPQC